MSEIIERVINNEPNGFQQENYKNNKIK
jgi:hypothetical protein